MPPAEKLYAKVLSLEAEVTDCPQTTGFGTTPIVLAHHIARV
jgi:hypothetical protein